jgi:sec-independent protein translocase protein TatA
MGIPGGWELLAVIAVIVLLFGAKKIPDFAKGLGTGIREFKKATHEEENAPRVEKKDDASGEEKDSNS